MNIDFEALWEATRDWLLTQGLELLLIVILAMVVLRILGIVIKRTFRAIADRDEDAEAEKRLATLQGVIRVTVGIVVVAVAVMMILQNLGVEIGAVLAAAGVVGIAVGFGSQQLVQDVISGFFLLIENQIRVGDVVQIAGKAGLVEKINLRMTVLRDLSGNVHFVRNGHIDTVTNMTKGFSFYVFDIGVAYRENTDEVIEVMKQVGQELREDDEFKSDILEDLEVMGVDKFADSAVVIKARFKTRPIKQWRVGRAYNARLKHAFDKADIEIPFPHVTVYAGQDKDGTAPTHPLQVHDPGGSGNN